VLDVDLWYLPPGRAVGWHEYVENPYVRARCVPRVAHSTVMTREGMAASVSTVFLFHDHNWSRLGPPILWETMVFGEVLDLDCHRYHSPEAASVGHRETLTEVLTELDLRGTPELVTVTWRGSWWRQSI
jgi:hypothetical protein